MGLSAREGLQDGYIKFGPVAIVVSWCVTGVTVGPVIFTTLEGDYLSPNFTMGRLREVKCPALSHAGRQW